jgi:hypothetical protein
MYDEKFLTGIQILSGTLPFTVIEGDDLQRLTQDQEDRRTMTIDFEFHRGLKNSVTTFQAVVRQPGMTNLINGPTRPPIGTTSTTTRSFRLALGEI